ncbi:hypothetical protein D1007_26605 [Hordeum vulgare]|nr:hypothetical protein D1007_26605 [Hordeum vulgare]
MGAAGARVGHSQIYRFIRGSGLFVALARRVNGRPPLSAAFAATGWSTTVVLYRHIVLLCAATKNHVASLMSVRCAIDAQLYTPPNLLWVTSHDPEDFLVHFELPAHRDNVVCLGALNVGVVSFVIKS